MFVLYLSFVPFVLISYLTLNIPIDPTELSLFWIEMDSNISSMFSWGGRYTFPNIFWTLLLLAVSPFRLTEMLTPKGWANARCVGYNHLKFQAGKSGGCSSVSMGSAKAALLGRLRCHHPERPVPRVLRLCVCSAVFQNHTSSLHPLWRNSLFLLL